MPGADNDSSERRALLTARLAGGDRRSTGAANEVAREAVADPGLAPLLVALMAHADPVVRMRAADALEKASRQRPELLLPHIDALVRDIGVMEQQEVRWHVAQMIPRLPMDARQHAIAVALLKSHLDDRSRIVVVEALAALAALAEGDSALREWVLPELTRAARDGTPAARARARRLLADLTAPSR